MAGAGIRLRRVRHLDRHHAAQAGCPEPERWTQRPALQATSRTASTPAVVALALARRVALGVAWLLDGLEVTVVGSLGGGPERRERWACRPPRSAGPDRPTSAGAVLGRALFGRLADRLGPQAAVSHHACGLSCCDGPHGVHVRLPVVRAMPLPYRVRDRRRVRGDQFGHRRADPGARARASLTWRSTARSGSARSGAGMSIVLLDPACVGPELGWRLAFGLGAVLALRYCSCGAMCRRVRAG